MVRHVVYVVSKVCVKYSVGLILLDTCVHRSEFVPDANCLIHCVLHRLRMRRCLGCNCFNISYDKQMRAVRKSNHEKDICFVNLTIIHLCMPAVNGLTGQIPEFS
jgi:hypothetical protein